MAKPAKGPSRWKELLVSGLAQTDALVKTVIEKGLISLRRVYAEDFRGMRDVSGAPESHAAMNSRSLA